jgi:hypothetical protein
MQSAALLRNRAKMSKSASMSLDMGTVRALCPKDAGKVIILPEVGGLQASPGFILGPPLWFGFGTPRNQVHASLLACHVSCPKN